LIDVGGVRHSDILVRRRGSVVRSSSCQFSFPCQLLLLLLLIASRCILCLTLLLALFVVLGSLRLLTDPAREASGDKSTRYVSG